MGKGKSNRAGSRAHTATVRVRQPPSSSSSSAGAGEPKPIPPLQVDGRGWHGTYEEHAARKGLDVSQSLREVFGRTPTPAEIAALVGAPPGANIIVDGYIQMVHIRTELPATSPGQQFPTLESRVGFLRGEDGKIASHVHWIGVAPSAQGQGLGTRAMATMVKYQTAAGVDHIGLEAGVGGHRDMIGNRVWYRLGFDGPIPPRYHLREFPETGAPPAAYSARTLRELVSDPALRAWWDGAGMNIKLKFYTGDRRSQDVLRRYLADKGIDWATL